VGKAWNFKVILKDSPLLNVRRVRTSVQPFNCKKNILIQNVLDCFPKKNSGFIE